MPSLKIITSFAKDQWHIAELTSLLPIHAHLHKHTYEGLTSSERKFFWDERILFKIRNNWYGFLINNQYFSLLKNVPI